MRKRFRVLFICTGNSCRTQMAEGLTRAIGGNMVEAASAGLEPKGVDPRAKAAMAEVGIDISGQTSKALTPEMLDKADLVITVCGDAKDRCPPVPPGKRRLHWPLADPAAASGTPAEEAAVFTAARDEIVRRVSDLVGELRRDSLAVSFAGRRIMVVVCGGIAAYKVAGMVSSLRRAAAEVHVTMTRSAQRFVGSATFEALSGNRVLHDLFADGAALEHVRLADTADAVLVAPATADVIGKLACGIADDAATTVLMAVGVRKPVVIAPAMNSGMWENPVVQKNVAGLTEMGYRFAGPDFGRLAEGYEGIGRLAGEEEILAALAKILLVK